MPPNKPALPKLEKSNGLEIPWCEYAGIGNTSAADAGFKPNDNRATMPILVYEENMDELPGEILGYARRNGDALSRKLPWRHPRWNWMYAEAIASVKGMGPVGVLGGRGTHQLYMVTVVFGVPAYEIAPDGEKEYNRWTEKRIKPCAQFLTIDRGEYMYADTEQVPATLRKEPIGSGPGLLIQDALITWTWRHVPHNYVMDRSGMPMNFLWAIGKINAGYFGGCPKGTLLLESVDPEPVSAPVDPEKIGRGSGKVPRLWDITITMKYRDPPTTPGGLVNGWNLAPAPAADPKGLWYPIVSTPKKNFAGGAPRYQETDFQELFSAVANPED